MTEPKELKKYQGDKFLKSNLMTLQYLKNKTSSDTGHIIINHSPQS